MLTALVLLFNGPTKAVPNCSSIEEAVVDGVRQCQTAHPNPAKWLQRAEMLDPGGCTWQPSTCNIRKHSQLEACELLVRMNHTRILVVGNSIMRDLYTSLLMTLLGERVLENPHLLLPTFAWHPSAIDAERNGKRLYRCSTGDLDGGAYTGHCRFQFPGDTWVHLDAKRQDLLCGGRVHLAYAHHCNCLHPIMNASNTSQSCSTPSERYGQYNPACAPHRRPDPSMGPEAPLSMRTNTSASLVLLGIGIGEEFDVDAATSILQELLADLAANFSNHPKVVWFAADFHEDQRYPWQTTPRVIKYNSAMHALLRRRRTPFPWPYDTPMAIVNTYNVTAKQHSKDGTHSHRGISHLKVQLLLQLLSTQLMR